MQGPAPRALLVLAGFLAVSFARGEPPRTVEVRRVPGGGIQPQVAAGSDGTVHLIYFRGDPGAGDVYYARSRDGGETFSEPVRVNRTAGSAIATGNVRGAHLSLGREDRVHVAWMGSKKAEPRGPGDSTPMLYTRLADDGESFEPARNVVRRRKGLDGGGSVAADQDGNVYVVWHAPAAGAQGEEGRAVWVAWSRDDGGTFAPEVRADSIAAGCCACCGIRAGTDASGKLHVLYRTARGGVNRDMVLLSGRPKQPFAAHELGAWRISKCVMSTSAFGVAGDRLLACWETEGKVYWAPAAKLSGGHHGAKPVAPPHARAAKHPVIAGDAHGWTILAWTEGMGWARGGALAWQVFDAQGKPVEGLSGRRDGVPVWSLVAVFARPGGFTVLY